MQIHTVSCQLTAWFVGELLLWNVLDVSEEFISSAALVSGEWCCGGKGPSSSETSSNLERAPCVELI